VADEAVNVGEGAAETVGEADVAAGVAVSSEVVLVVGLGEAEVTAAGDELVDAGEAEFLQPLPGQPLASALGTLSESSAKADAATTTEAPTDVTARGHGRAESSGRV
jgi:hypothetical protein